MFNQSEAIKAILDIRKGHRI